MSWFYKIFLALFLIFIGLSLYAMDWYVGILHENNTMLLLSLSISIVGIILVVILNQLSKIKAK